MTDPHHAVAHIDGKRIPYTVVAYERNGRWYDSRLRSWPRCKYCGRVAVARGASWCSRCGPVPRPLPVGEAT